MTIPRVVLAKPAFVYSLLETLVGRDLAVLATGQWGTEA